MAQKSERHIVVVRSTMLPGSVAGTVIPALEKASGLRCGEGFGIAINPEFLRESSAIHDFDHPPKTVIGARDRADAEKIAALYEKLDAPLFLTSLETAEMVKYTDNAFHAVKVTFANEIGALAKSCGIDGREVLEIFCADRKLNISPAYLRPGFAYGGSCLPKDLRALTRMAQNCGVTLPMLNALSISNTEQIQRATERVLREGRPVVAVLGFAFKGGTDDLRESPVVTLVESLIGKGLDLRLFDRNVSLARLIGANRRFIEERIPHISRLMVNEAAAACEGADVVVVGNESAEHWEVLRTLDPRQKVIDLTPAKPGIETPAQYERISS
jgi:GDP-mannose 6-dehydrogenase